MSTSSSHLHYRVLTNAFSLHPFRSQAKKKYRDDVCTRFFTTPSKKKARSSQNEHYIAEFQKLVFKFINNGNHFDSTCEDPNFRNMIDFGINNAKFLKGATTT